MGAYSEYLGKRWSYAELEQERKKQLLRISEIRQRDVLVIAADQSKSGMRVTVSLEYNDILPVEDQLSMLNGENIDVIIETPGGLAEVAENIVRLIRSKYVRVGMIVPGWAKSAGTILVMAGDEILMGASSSLGPIDPQIGYANGKRFSADALLEGLDKIKEEVVKQGGKLNPAYIPILQTMSPGEIQACVNAREFSQTLVREWLAKYKFKYWDVHETSQTPVTEEQKAKRAREIAEGLCQHSRWLTHGRSITREDLESLGLKITNYAAIPELNDAVTRYYALLKMSFEKASLYKLFETPKSQVMRFVQVGEVKPGQQAGALKPGQQMKASVKFTCPNCGRVQKIQANIGKQVSLDKDHVAFPINNVFICPQCGTESNLLALRLEIEAKTKNKIV